jgi:hypothetical protein
MKRFKKLFVFLIFLLGLSALAQADCRNKYKRFLNSKESRGTQEEWSYFKYNQTPEGRDAIKKGAMNRTTWMRYRHQSYKQAKALIDEAYSRGATPLVNRISKKTRVSKNKIFKFLMKHNKSGRFCDRDAMMDYSNILMGIIGKYNPNLFKVN